MLKIDIHTHILPKQWPNLKAKYGYGGFPQMEHCNGCGNIYIDDKLFRQVKPNCWDPVTRIAECDANEVSVQVLSTVPVMFSYWTKPQHGYDIAQLLNDHLAQTVAAYPTRFLALGTLPLQDTELSIKELERCTKELGFVGVQIGSHVNGCNLDDERFFPIFAAAAELGAAIFIHPWDMLAKERMEKYWLSWLVGMPSESALAFCSLMFGGVLEKLPNLRIAFSHGGGAFPATIGRIIQGFTARPDLFVQNGIAHPKQYLKRIYVDTLVHEPLMLKYLIDLLGVERIALGTDYPFPLGEQKPGSIIHSTNLNEMEKARLFHGTALEWLNLSADKFL